MIGCNPWTKRGEIPRRSRRGEILKRSGEKYTLLVQTNQCIFFEKGCIWKLDAVSLSSLRIPQSSSSFVNWVHLFLHHVLRTSFNYQMVLCIKYHVFSDVVTLWNAHTSYEMSQFLLKNPNLWTLQRPEIQEHDQDFKARLIVLFFISNCWGTQMPWDLILGNETDATQRGGRETKERGRRG